MMKTTKIHEPRFETIEHNECARINGGSFLVAIAIGLAIGVGSAAGSEIFGDWDNFKAGLAGKPEIK